MRIVPQPSVEQLIELFNTKPNFSGPKWDFIKMYTKWWRATEMTHDQSFQQFIRFIRSMSKEEQYKLYIKLLDS